MLFLCLKRTQTKPKQNKTVSGSHVLSVLCHSTPSHLVSYVQIDNGFVLQFHRSIRVKLESCNEIVSYDQIGNGFVLQFHGNIGVKVESCNEIRGCLIIIVKLKVHVLPREMLGRSTFGLSMWLLKWFPIRLVDGFLLMVSRLMLGDTARFGLDRPIMGPLRLKNMSGKTPVLDVGTLAKIKTGHIKVLFHFLFKKVLKCIIVI